MRLLVALGLRERGLVLHRGLGEVPGTNHRVADADELRVVRVHHATASGSAQGKLDALDGFLAAWLAAHNLTRAELALPPAGAAWTDT